MMQTMSIVMQSILLGYMCIQDFRKKEIYTSSILCYGVCCIIYGSMQLKNGNMSFLELSIGVSMGFVLIGIAYLSKQQIGLGDGMVVALMGVAMGMTNIMILSIASILTSIVAIILLASKKGTKKTTLPFLPGITAGYVMCMLLR